MNDEAEVILPDTMFVQNARELSAAILAVGTAARTIIWERPHGAKTTYRFPESKGQTVEIRGRAREVFGSYADRIRDNRRTKIARQASKLKE